MSGLLYILIALLVSLFWVDSLRAREAATEHAKRACKKHQLQFLDQTVALGSIRLRWTLQGIRLRRAYNFEYSIEGAGRERGEITMIGSRFESIDIAQFERVKEITPL